MKVIEFDIKMLKSDQQSIEARKSLTVSGHELMCVCSVFPFFIVQAKVQEQVTERERDKKESRRDDDPKRKSSHT